MKSVDVMFTARGCFLVNFLSVPKEEKQNWLSGYEIVKP